MGPITHKIDKIREEKKVTKIALANAVGVTRETIYNLSDDTIKLSTLLKICQFLNVSIVEIFSPKTKVSEPFTEYKTEKKQDCEEVRQELAFYKGQYESDRNTIKALTLAVNNLTTQLERSKLKKS